MLAFGCAERPRTGLSAGREAPPLGPRPRDQHADGSEVLPLSGRWLEPSVTAVCSGGEKDRRKSCGRYRCRGQRRRVWRFAETMSTEPRFIEKLEKNCAAHPDDAALISAESGKSMSYAGLWECSGRVYGFLKQKGIGKEAAVMIALPRGDPLASSPTVGIWRAGGGGHAGGGLRA